MKGLEAKTLGLKKVIRHEYKRIVAFMLTVAMVVTNFGTNLTVAFAAGEETSSLFLLDSSELEDAISTALESGDVFDFSSLELKAKQKSLKTSYEKLIGSKAGKVYQLDVDIDSSYATEHTDLQVFYNAGTDDVVFLFINESDMAVTFRANVSGYETARVTVNPNTTNIEDAEGVENAEDYSGTTMVDDEKKPQAEVVKPEGETSETVENGSDETEEETKADVTESENASENGETEETTGAENSSETEETTAREETEAEVEETAEETEAAEPETEAPAAEEELQAEEGSATASISAKEVFRVSTSAEVAEETLADSTEEETEAETEDKAEVPEKETEAIPETTEAEETVAEDKTEETVADESKADETTAADETADGETVADETKDGELVNDETEAPAENPADENSSEAPADNNGGRAEADFDGDEQFLEDDSIELMGELSGKAYNTVTIWGRANARAYAVKAEDLVGEAAVEGQYNVDYSVDPVGAAAIKGAHTVNEGETLYFAVDPQVGYEITEVTANGEELEEVDAAGVASASNLEKYAHVYAVEEVSEDLEIVASLEETENVAHPEFNASYVSSDGVTISLHAEEGILPEGTELDVTEVTEALGDTIKEKMEGESEGAVVNTVLAYDINLLYNGEKLSNSWSEDGYVDVTFTGAPIQEMTETSDKVEIVAVDDTSKTQLTAEKAEAVEASELKLESVSEQSVEGAAVEEVGFKAEHFTIYAITSKRGQSVTGMVELNDGTYGIGKTIEVYVNDTSDTEGNWESSNPSVASVVSKSSVNVNGSRRPAATITTLSVGTTEISYTYETHYGMWSWTEKVNATIKVEDASLVVAQFYYLKDSTKNPDSNNTGEWSSNLGTGYANEVGGIWTGNKNIFDAQTRVVTWPSGYGTKTADGKLLLTRDTNTWNTIFTVYRDDAAKKAGVQNLQTKDVEAIYLVPYKISKDNSTSPDHHVDCTVELKVKQLVTVQYRLKDASTDNVYRASEDGQTVRKNDYAPRPKGTYPLRKQDANGVWYEFEGWYTNPELIGDPVDFDSYVVTENTIFYARYVGEHNVNYEWTGLPTGETLYDEDGAVVTPTLPTGITGLKTGQTYRIDTTKPGTVVYTHDEYGNQNAKYTFGNWNDPNNGVMGNSDVTVEGAWTVETVKVPTHKITYSWSGNVPSTVVLPQDNKTYKHNEPYLVDEDYAPGYSVNSYDAYHNVNGVYTFSGWDTKAGNITSDLEIRGTWKFEKTEVARHNVKYSWSGLPANTEFYNAAGESANPVLPMGYTGLVNGEPYSVDTTMPKTVVYTHDEYGNQNAKYTFGNWNDPNNGVMGNSDVTVEGAWTVETVKVPTHKITYSWSGNVPSTVVLPQDNKTYKHNEPYLVDEDYAPGYSVNSYDAYHNVNGVYTFSGWDTKAGNITSDLEIRGTWKFEKTEVARHNVKYSWSGLPANTEFYNVAGESANPVLPMGYTGLVNGEPYSVDTTMPKTVVYTHDEYGNQNAKYTFGNWNDPNNGVMGNSDVTVEGAWTVETVKVPTHKITYSWSGNVPSTVVLPQDNKTYKHNEPYLVDEDYAPGYSVNSYDAYHNVNGVYTFSGWDTKAGNITSDLEIRGTWKFEKTEVARHNVKYSWSGLPANTEFYNAAGESANPVLPMGYTGLVNGEPYSVDTTMPKTVVYTHDEYGNQNAKYTFGNWNDPNNGVMGNSDVTVEGAWTVETVKVPTHKITYSWSGNVPSTVVLPQDNKTYKHNEPYLVDEDYAPGYSVNSYDAYHNVNGVYTFSGWDTKAGNITSDLEIRGIWKFEKTEVARHNVKYSWSGLPANTEFYNAAGESANPVLPMGYTGLVNGEPYSVDTTMPKTVVYTHDEYGNQNAKYTFGNWNDPNNGVMGNSDVTVEGAWTVETVKVPTHKITYSWNGDIPSTVVLPQDNKTYKHNEPYLVDEDYAPGYSVNSYDAYHNVNGVYTFSGWDTKAGNITSDLEIRGTWKFEKTEVARHNVKYSWSGLPANTEFYNVAGESANPVLPMGYTGLVNGEPYSVDTTMPKAVVYTHDEYGNPNAKYTFGNWNDPNNGVMGNSDVTVEGAWTKENIPVTKYSVIYKYSDAPANAPKVPETVQYVKNQPVTVEDVPQLKGYRFIGWDSENVTVSEGKFVMPDRDVEFIGRFEKDNFPYEVNYHYSDKNDKEVDLVSTTVNGIKLQAEFESEIPYSADQKVNHKNVNYALDKVIFGNTDGANGKTIVTDKEAKNVIDVYYSIDELGTNPEEPTKPNKPDGIPDKYQVVFTYVAEDHGVVTGTVKEVVTRYEGDKKFSTTAPAYPNAAVTATPDSGYNFVNWTSDNPSEASKNIVAVLSTVLQRYSATNAEFADVDEIRNAGFTKDTKFTAHFIASDATTYKVEVYYEHEGKYSSVPSKSIPMTGVTDTQATVKAEDYLPTSGYVFDQNAANVLSGTIAGDNSLVLKVYYKQVFKVTYAPGDHGSFKSQTYTAFYGNQTPGFSGDKTANGNYRFTGWDKTIESKVTGDIVYTAQWAANSNGGGNGGGGGGSSSGGGGGSSSGPRDNGSTPSGGPGATTVTIDPDAVPLANLPNEDGAADLLVIDDEDVPLAALPKTGQSGASGLVLFLSSMMLAAFVAVSKKREDDK